MNGPSIANVLYLAVYPQISLSGTDFGKVQQILTLMPDRNFASAFFLDEVETYIQVFRNRESHLVGGHVKSYDIVKEPTNDGRVYVRVTQNVG
jgi:hypothetical protein